MACDGCRTGKKLDDEIKWIKFGSVSWTKDGKGFFYSRYDEPKEDEKFQGLNLDQKVYYHRIGDDQSQDKLIYQDPDHPNGVFHPKSPKMASTW